MPGLLLRLAIPTMLAQLINVLYSIVDRMFIGHIEEVGSLALAGVGVCGPIIALLSSFSLLVGLGGTPLMGMKLGSGDQEGASQLLWLSALLSGGLNSFLIAQGRSGLGMGTVVLGAVLNIVLDPVFIFGLGMGVSGAAWATVISQGAACIFVLVSLRLPSLPVPLRWGRLDPKLCRRVVSLGMSPFLTYALDSVILIVLNSTLQHRGGPGEGDILITCAAIVQSYILLIFMPMSGITLGCQGVVSFNLGAGSAKRVKQALLGVFLLCLTFSAFMLGATQFFAPHFVRFFSDDAEVLTRSVKYITIYTAGTLFMAPQWMATDMSTALGNVHLALFCSLFRKSLFLVGVLLFPVLFTAAAAFAAEPFCDAIACVMSTTLFLRFTPRLIVKYCAQPGMRDELRRPMMLLVSARKKNG